MSSLYNLNIDNWSVKITEPDVLKKITGVSDIKETMKSYALGKSLKDVNLTLDLAPSSDYTALQSFINDWRNRVGYDEFIDAYNKNDIKNTVDVLRLSYRYKRIPRIAKKAMKVTYKRNTKGKRLLAKLRLDKRYPTYRFDNCRIVANSEQNVDDLLTTEYTINFEHYAKEV